MSKSLATRICQNLMTTRKSHRRKIQLPILAGAVFLESAAHSLPLTGQARALKGDAVGAVNIVVTLSFAFVGCKRLSIYYICASRLLRITK